MANIEILAEYDKQPADVQDYDISFASWLTALLDTGASHSVTADAGLTIASSSLSAGVVKVWASGGTADNAYKITATLVSVGGRTKEAEIVINVVEV